MYYTCFLDQETGAQRGKVNHHGFPHCKQLALDLNSSVVDTNMALGNQGCPEEEQSDRAAAPLPAFVQASRTAEAPTLRLAWRVGVPLHSCTQP